PPNLSVCLSIVDIQQYLQLPRLRGLLEGLLALAQGEAGGDQWGDVDVAGGECFEGGIERAAARADQRDLVDNERGQIRAGVSGDGCLENDRPPRPHESARGRQSGGRAEIGRAHV